MKKLELNPDDISKILSQHIDDPNVIFVFSTSTVMNSWIDWLVTHPEISGTDAVAFERFIAWDNFKREYLSVSKEGLTAIPSLLKLLFVYDLIEKNAQKPQQERLKVIINPKDEFAKNAFSFAQWITTNLSALNFWKKRLEQYKAEYGHQDSEDLDYEFIYNSYASFLEQNRLFEPSWLDNLDFIDSTKQFIFFYPEMLQDFSDFTDTFENSSNITIFSLPEKLPSPQAYLFNDSRSELRITILRIIELVKNKKADWSEIALSVPDLETYRPYLEREFMLYSVPYVIKAGFPLTRNNAGRIFLEIFDCYNSNFTFDSVRSLLLDECVPWKDEYLNLKEELIREGSLMRCICSPYEKDIWLSAFTSRINKGEKRFVELLKFYRALKKHINLFFEGDFENIKKAWMQFKGIFLKSDKEFSVEANNILSRCIKELDELIQIQKDFEHCNLKVNSAFQVFLNILKQKTYTPQTQSTGVQIFKYKLSSAAFFKYQFVIDGSQKNLEVVNKRLSFLNSTKRAKLHLFEDDLRYNATEAFIKLYAKKVPGQPDENFIHFSAATDTFAGYAIPHSYLSILKIQDSPALQALDEQDYILAEKKFFMDSTQNQTSTKLQNLNEITPFQVEMFTSWKNTRIEDLELAEDQNNNSTDSASNHLIRSSKPFFDLIEKRKAENGRLIITARSDLEPFFPCPRKWVFKTLLKLKDDTLDTSLMQSFDMANLNHKILELILQKYTGQKLPCYNEEPSFLEHIKASVEKAIVSVPDFRDCPLVIKTLKDQTDALVKFSMSFLKQFLLPFGETKDGFGNCIVHGLEETRRLERENFEYYGRIDCLLETPQSEWIIIDFKNTESAVDKKLMFADTDGILQDFQMPLYKKLVSDDDKKKVYAMHYCIMKDCTTVSVLNPLANAKSKAKKDLDEYQPTLNALEAYAQTFEQAVQNKAFTPHHSNNKADKLNVKTYEHCSSCKFKTICRTTYTVAAKNILLSGGSK